MKAAWMRSTLLALVLIAQILLVAGHSAAQENYPVPRGNPDTWGIPGHTEKLPVKPQFPFSMFSAPSPLGNEGQNGPTGPAGEAEEKYTGTKEFGGIAGTGIDKSGIPWNR